MLAGACSWFRPGAAGEPMPADPNAITIVVQNNVMPPTAITVYIIEEGGTSTRLGQVSGASTERFTPRIPPTGRARLYARSSDGGERTSNFVSLRPSQTLEWDLFTNIVTERFGGGVSVLVPFADRFQPDNRSGNEWQIVTARRTQSAQ
jgi:hypothetical protein